MVVEKDGTEYLFGAAYYSGNPGGTEFKMVGELHLTAENQKTLFGGTFYWNNSHDNDDETGTAGWDKWRQSDDTIYYVCDQPSKNNHCGKSSVFSIVGICVEFVEIE